MNPRVLHGLTTTYIDDFLEEVKHLHNLILVKTAVARTTYGSIVKIKIYRHLKGVWERYFEHITRVKYEWDLHILQGTLHNYQTMLQYMYDSIHTSGTSTDSE